MLQSTEYQTGPYFRWFWRSSNYSRVMHRRTLVMTAPAKLLYAALSIGMVATYLAAAWLIYRGLAQNVAGAAQVGLALLVITPVLWAQLITIPLILGRWLIIKPRQAVRVRRSRHVFANHEAITIAVAGSYGKTTMKEMLYTVLSLGKKVAATPANKNVAISHAIFADSLEGDEEIIIIEYGEGGPGDVKRFAKTTKPDVGIITGLAPAHLDKYKTLERAGRDIFSLADYLKDDQVYVNSESQALKPFVRHGHFLYGQNGVGSWKVTNVQVSLQGTNFTLKKGKTTYKLNSPLLGRHHIGPLALCAVLGHDLGLTKQQIEHGVAATKPFEHRMQPYQMSGAWIIDDTYNGNIDGMKAGLALLKELPAKRKTYITPGLVDQGRETKKVHIELGRAIAEAAPDRVVLMHNSVTTYILEGLENGNFNGSLVIEHNPLEYYQNLNHFLAAGDLVLMQNDWTDNYA